MKTLLLLLCLCLSAQAQLALNNAFYNVFGNNVQVAYDYFLEENFEAPGYENTWTQAGTGTINDQYDNPPAPLEGLFSLRIQLAVDNRRTTNIFAAPHSTVYGFCMVLFPNLPNEREFISLWNDDTLLMSIDVEDPGGNLFFRTPSSSTGTTASGISQDTLYYLWFRYTKGTGANAIFELQFSTTPTKPASGGTTLSVVNGSSTLDANRIAIGATAGNQSMQIIIDKIRLSETEIGSNPE